MGSTTHAEVEFFIVVDDDGNYVVAVDQDDAHTSYADDISGSGARQLIKMTVQVPLPKTIEVAATLPQNDRGEYSLAITSA